MNPQLVMHLLFQIINQRLLKEKFVRWPSEENKHVVINVLSMHMAIKPLGEINTSA